MMPRAAGRVPCKSGVQVFAADADPDAVGGRLVDGPYGPSRRMSL